MSPSLLGRGAPGCQPGPTLARAVAAGRRPRSRGVDRRLPGGAPPARAVISESHRGVPGPFHPTADPRAVAPVPGRTRRARDRGRGSAGNGAPGAREPAPAPFDFR